MLVIPDASVILKWVLPPENEEYVHQARRVLDSYVSQNLEFLVPALWLFEVGNILSIKYIVHAEARMRRLCDLHMPLIEPTDNWRHTVLELVHKHGVTFYDAAYHATALVSGGVLVSADAPYLRKVRTAGGAQHLRNWP